MPAGLSMVTTPRPRSAVYDLAKGPSPQPAQALHPWIPTSAGMTVGGSGLAVTENWLFPHNHWTLQCGGSQQEWLTQQEHSTATVAEDCLPAGTDTLEVLRGQGHVAHLAESPFHLGNSPAPLAGTQPFILL